MLNGICVVAAYHATGAGSALLSVAIGSAPALLWTVQNHPRAAAFYRKHGFAPDGATSEYATLGTTIIIECWVR